MTRVSIERVPARSKPKVRATPGSAEQYREPAILNRLAALKTMKIGELRTMWTDLFETDPPMFNRKFLESRLAYRIQELAFGGLQPQTIERLTQLAKELETGKAIRKPREDNRPIAGTRLIREWQGVEHSVLVTSDGYDYGGRPYKSLSAVARAITGTRWNGWVFFGLKNHRQSRKG